MNKIVVIFPHPDDETFSLALTLHEHFQSGDEIVYYCLTDGQNGRNLGKPVIANRETLPQIRRKELKDAAKVIGIKEVHHIGLYDKLLEFLPLDEGVSLVTDIIEKENPSIIYTFYPGYSVHPDHDVTGLWVQEAVRKLGSQRPKVFGVAFAHNTEQALGKPLYVNVSDKYMPMKLDAIRAHHSQTSFHIDKLESDFKKGNKKTVPWLVNERYWEIK